MISDIGLKNKTSWLVAIALSIVIYFVYYDGLFGLILKAYNQQFQAIKLRCDLSTDNSTLDCNSFLVTLYFPRNLDDSGGQSIFIKVKNTSSTDFDGILYLALLNDNTIAASPLVSENLSGELIDGDEEQTALPDLDTTVDNSIIPILIASTSTTPAKVDLLLKPNSTDYLKIPFPYPGSALKNPGQILAMFLDSKEDVLSFRYLPESDLNNLEISSLNSTLYILIEKILLPPWANVLIPLFSVVCVWFFEQRIVKDGEEDERPVTMRDFLRLLFPSLGAAFVIIAILCVGIAVNSLVFFLLAPFLVIGFWLLTKKNLTKIHTEHLVVRLNSLFMIAIVLILVLLIYEKRLFVIGFYNRIISDQYTSWDVVTTILLIAIVFAAGFLFFSLHNKDMQQSLDCLMSSAEKKDISTTTKEVENDGKATVVETNPIDLVSRMDDMHAAILKTNDAVHQIDGLLSEMNGKAKRSGKLTKEQDQTLKSILDEIKEVKTKIFLSDSSEEVLVNLKCSVCGSENPKSARFCLNCGTRFDMEHTSGQTDLEEI
jgi:hypothetical protein